MNLASLGMEAASGLAGTIMGEINSLLGRLTGKDKREDERQLKQQQALMNQQIGAQKELALNAQELNKEMFDYTAESNRAYNDPSAQMERLKAAGLNAGLMYGGAGAGGTTTGTPGSQSAPTISGGNADTPSASKAALIS